MSLLLEALNRSESERKQQENLHGVLPLPRPAPHPLFAENQVALSHAPHAQHGSGATIINTGNQTPWFLVILCFNALLFVVAALFWMQLENQKNNNDVLLYSHLMKQESNYLNNAKQPVIKQREQPSLAQLVVEEAANTLTQLNAGKSREVLPSEPVTMVNIDGLAIKNRRKAAEKKARVAEVAQPAQAPEPIFIPEDNTIYQLNELPTELAVAFPQLSYNAHLYSPDLPSARMIMINDKKYSEKDYVQKEMQIDQITPEGVIYKFKQVKLRVDVVSELQ